MAGTLKTNRQQLGDSATATQNFTITAEAADGTMKIARGNAGATTQDVLTVDASGKVAIPQGMTGLTITQANQTPLPAVNTTISYTHGLGVVPVSAELELVCLTAELGYAVGDVVTPFVSGASFTYPFSIAKNSTTVFARTGSSGPFQVVNMANGVNGAMTAANWAWRFKVRVS